MSFQWLLVPLFLSFLTIRTSGMHLSLNPARRATTELANHHELGFSTTIFLGGEDFVVMVDLDRCVSVQGESLGTDVPSAQIYGSPAKWCAAKMRPLRLPCNMGQTLFRVRGRLHLPCFMYQRGIGSIRIAKLEFMDIDIDNQAFRTSRLSAQISALKNTSSPGR